MAHHYGIQHRYERPPLPMKNLSRGGEQDVLARHRSREEIVERVDRFEGLKLRSFGDGLQERIARLGHASVDGPNLHSGIDPGVQSDRGHDVEGLDPVGVPAGKGIVVRVLLPAEVEQATQGVGDPQTRAQPDLVHELCFLSVRRLSRTPAASAWSAGMTWL